MRKIRILIEKKYPMRKSSLVLFSDRYYRHEDFYLSASFSRRLFSEILNTRIPRSSIMRNRGFLWSPAASRAAPRT